MKHKQINPKDLVIVFDIDGTIANIEHRRNWVRTKPKNWKAFIKAIPQDTPHNDILFLNHTFHQLGSTNILCSGRSEPERAATVEWMERHGVNYTELFMRAAGDYRDDGIVKTELLAKIEEKYGKPFLWFDDRQRVVDAIRKCGIRVLQVAPGNF